MNLTTLKAITFGLGLMILVALGALGYGAFRQAGKLQTDNKQAAALSTSEAAKPFGTLELKEPPGTEIRQMTAAQHRLYLHVSGGGKPDRVLVLDGDGGTALGTIIVPAQNVAADVEAAPVK